MLYPLNGLDQLVQKTEFLFNTPIIHKSEINHLRLFTEYVSLSEAFHFTV